VIPQLCKKITTHKTIKYVRERDHTLIIVINAQMIALADGTIQKELT